jgi:hypothetical protein
MEGSRDAVSFCSEDNDGDSDSVSSESWRALSVPALFRPPPAFFFSLPRNRSIVKPGKDVDGKVLSVQFGVIGPREVVMILSMPTVS